ncbi:MAG: hypothetical protein ACUVX8_07585 [Candidatus Zipacnadales bacterium]
MPGEFCLGALFNTSPDPACYLTEPFLDAEGRAACQEGLKRALGEVLSIASEFTDTQRMKRVIRCLHTMLHMLTTVRLVKRESWAD